LILLQTLDNGVDGAVVKLVDVADGEVFKDWVTLNHAAKGMDH
jgi:hypothetical protein